MKVRFFMSVLALVPAAVSAQQILAPVSPWNAIVPAQVEKCWTPPVSIQGGKGVRVSLDDNHAARNR